MKKLVLALFAICYFALLVPGQTPTGSLTGTVSGPDGVLPGATVEITYTLTGKTQTATTNSNGGFNFLQLEPGVYTVKITAQGFKGYIANDVKIDVGREFSIAPMLEVGGFQETVTVTTGADIVTATTGQISNVVTPQQILSMPLLTRNPLELTAMQPGVQTSNVQLTTINGMRTTATNITRDGISINDPFIRSNATDFAPGRPSVDDTGEFTLVSAAQEADSGGGAQIQVVTPRGTNQYHGALFAYNRNSTFEANNFFNNRSRLADGTPAPISRAPAFRNRWQYGGKVGGPFPTPHFGEGGPTWDRDKGFFFFAYEAMRDPFSQIYNRTILTPAARGGAFTFQRAVAGSPINSGGISCPNGAAHTAAAPSLCTVSNILTFAQSQFGAAAIPGTINPVIQSRILDLMPTEGNLTGVGDGINTTGYTLNRQFNTTRNQYTTRIDLDATERDSMNFVYSWNREDVLRPDVDDTGFTASPDVTQYSENLQLSFAYRRVITDSLVNEVRWGRFTNVVPFDRISDYPDFYLGSLTPLGAIPTTTNAANLLGNLITNPTNVFMDQGRNNKVITFADNATWVKGNHSFRFGGLYQKYQVNSYNDFGIVPHYLIGNTSVPGQQSTLLTSSHFNIGGGGSLIGTTQLGEVNGLLAILAGLVNGEAQAFNMQDIQTGYVRGERQLAPFLNWNHALYFTDRWQVRPGLTINAGVRYELYPALRIDNGLALEAIISDQNDPIGSLLNAGNGNFNVVGTNAGQEYRFYKTDYNNFLPSVSFAWTPNFEKGIGNWLFGNSGKTVIRGGYSHVLANDQIITALNNTITSGGTGNIGLGRQTAFATGPANSSLLNLRAGQSQEIPTPVFTGAQRTFLQNNTSAQSNFGNAAAVDPNLQVPMIRQYSFGIQRELPWDMVIEARYVGTSSNNLLRSYNLNEIEIVNNGFLADFQRAQANFNLTRSLNPGNSANWTAFCNPAALAGCQALTLFRSGTTGTGPLVVGTSGQVTGLSVNTFNTAVTNGTVADLAHSFVTGGFNNHPTLAQPNRIPFVPFYQNPNTGLITLMLNDANYNYNSLQIDLRRRFTNGLFFGANYTLAKNLTNGQGTAQALNETYLQLDDKGLDYQRADFDIKHSFNFNGIYQLPFGKGKAFLDRGGWVNQLIGGWELSGILQIRSGVPITFVDPRGTLNRGTFSARQTPASNLSPDQIRDLMGTFEQVDPNTGQHRIYWIDPAALCPNGSASANFLLPSVTNPCPNQLFISLAPGQTSGLPRAFVDGPGFWNANASLMKNFNFTETMRLQFRAEAFNVFNNTNFQLVNAAAQFANVNSTSFGTLTSAAPARVMQFALRLEF